MATEVLQRYDFIDRCTKDATQQNTDTSLSITDRIDSVVTHKVFGPIIFTSILLLMFQAILAGQLHLWIS